MIGERNPARREGRLCPGSGGEAFNKLNGQQRPHSGDLKAKPEGGEEASRWTPEGGDCSKGRAQLVMGRLWGTPHPACVQESPEWLGQSEGSGSRAVGAMGGMIREVGTRTVQGFAGQVRTSAFNPEGSEKPSEECEQRSDGL